MDILSEGLRKNGAHKRSVFSVCSIIYRGPQRMRILIAANLETQEV
ncbi:MAG: hypothetical protein LBS83_01205 [Holosporales bacterium]|nr:hypothetical protein [Holosporales bacterium]